MSGPILFLTKADFRINASHFDLTQGWNILRIISGAFMFPHAMSKFTAGALSVGTVGFFAKAGFQPGAAGALAVAVYALQVVKGFGWTWNTGGYEYPVFWALVCVAIAIEARKVELAPRAARVIGLPKFA